MPLGFWKLFAQLIGSVIAILICAWVLVWAVDTLVEFGVASTGMIVGTVFCGCVVWVCALAAYGTAKSKAELDARFPPRKDDD